MVLTSMTFVRQSWKLALLIPIILRVPQSIGERLRLSMCGCRRTTSNIQRLINPTAIREYADRNGFRIEKTYTDSGKSGLNLDDRDALKELIDDVQSGKAE